MSGSESCDAAIMGWAARGCCSERAARPAEGESAPTTTGRLSDGSSHAGRADMVNWGGSCSILGTAYRRCSNLGQVARVA